MKRGQTTILLSVLVVSMFAAGFSQVQAAIGYQPLSPGDQLLYKNEFYFYEEIESKLFHYTDVSPTAESHWVIDHWDYVYDELESYSVNSIDTTIGNVNYTWSLFDRTNNRSQVDFYYNYGISDWVQNNSYLDLVPVSLSSFEVKDFNVYDGTLNLDATEWFNPSYLDHTEVRYYVINGINSSYNVDVYIDTVADALNNLLDYYGITVQEDNPYGWTDIFYVDSDSGFLLEYDTYYYDNYYREIDNKHSATLGTNVDYYYNHTYTYYYNWKLHETTVAFTPVIDADLPAMVIDDGYSYEIRGDSDTLPIYFDLYDSWTTMSVDVYLDGSLIDNLVGLTAGNNVYNLDTKYIPISSNNHTVQFIVSDDTSKNHNTTWSLEIQDIRPDWPRITGPEGDYYYTLGDFETLSWYLFDDFDNADYYELKLNTVVVHSGSWSNGTEIILNLETNLTAIGDYFVTIFASDLNGYYTYYDLIIHVSDVPDATPPIITGPTSTITINKGDSVQLVWNIQDENPNYYIVKLNGTEIINTPWFIEDFNVIINLDTLDVGFWHYEIYAYDMAGNPSSDFAYVEVTDDIAEPTEPTDPTDPTDPNSSNTLTLDAPGVITTILGFVSVVALVTIIRKRK